mmetsp:Transcript_42126/g.91526  ORF Transcript_42126/g.91526 Transcript_42126/m.91526 type:complete len:169 (-) Transcript_42126:497-1003(-)
MPHLAPPPAPSFSIAPNTQGPAIQGLPDTADIPSAPRLGLPMPSYGLRHRDELVSPPGTPDAQVAGKPTMLRDPVRAKLTSTSQVLSVASQVAKSTRTMAKEARELLSSIAPPEAMENDVTTHRRHLSAPTTKRRQVVPPNALHDEFAMWTSFQRFLELKQSGVGVEA